MSTFDTSLSTLSLFIGLALSGPAMANDNDTKEQYKPAFFAEYTPQTALDMIERLPGFVLVEADGNIRGFAQGAGNVLIDGARPTTKSGGIREALSRIPASQVAHIVMLRGATSSAEATGQSVVANVVRIRKAAAKRWQLAMEVSDEGDVSPSGEIALAQQFGEWTTAIRLDGQKQRSPRDATTETYSPDDTLTRSQTETRPHVLSEAFFSGDAKRQFQGHQLNVNARLGWSQFSPDTTRLSYQQRQPDNSPDSRFVNNRISQYYTGELGIDWIHNLDNNWQWRLLNLNNTQNWFVDADSTVEAPLDSFSSGTRLRFDEHKTENILRTTLSNKSSQGGKLSRQEYGLEVAYSNLESWLKLWALDSQDATINLNRGTYSKAVEQRTEGFANLTWQVYGLTIETGLAAEHSKLTVSGNSSDEQSLFFIKPSLAVIHDASETTQYRFNLRRSVGQLDFSDFAASADLDTNREFSGNPKLKPDTKIKAAFAVDYRFLEKGALSGEIYHEWRSDVLEQVILPSGDQGLGNAGDATVQGVKLSASLPLEAWIPESLLSLKADFAESDFDDVITGETRELTKLSSPSINVDFRQDLTEHKLSWGFGYQSFYESEDYYANEYNFFRTEGRWTAFIESYAFSDYKVRLWARNIGNEDQRWLRRVYQGDRSGPLEQREETRRNRGPFVSLTISRAF